MISGNPGFSISVLSGIGEYLGVLGMASDSAVKVTIIKRKVVKAAGHHGGAWKVAYADFVTAMMAFFLLMWLLNVSDAEMRDGLADYFSPTITVINTSGGGDGPFQGESLLSQNTLANDGVGQTGDPDKEEGSQDGSLLDIQETLSGASGDALDADPLMDHIATRLTDEGLIIEIFDLPGSPLFGGNTAVHNPILEKLSAMIGRIISHTANPVSISGHLAAGDVAPASLDPWLVSTDRANATRELLVASGLSGARLMRVTGEADRHPVTENGRDLRNRRIEVTLLRDFNQ